MTRKDRKLAEFRNDPEASKPIGERVAEGGQYGDDLDDGDRPVPAGVADPDEQRDDQGASDDAQEDASECDECGSPSVAYSDASAVHDGLPEKSLCRKCILDLL